jgi:hypothetical protein
MLRRVAMTEVMTLKKFKSMNAENRDKSLRLLGLLRANMDKGMKLREKYPELTLKLKEGEW